MIIGSRDRDWSQDTSFQLIDGSSVLAGIPYSSWEPACSCKGSKDGFIQTDTAKQETVCLNLLSFNAYTSSVSSNSACNISHYLSLLFRDPPLMLISNFMMQTPQNVMIPL